MHLNIGYPNSTTGSMYNRTALLSGEATREVRPKPMPSPIIPRLVPRLITNKELELELAQEETPTPRPTVEVSAESLCYTGMEPGIHSVGSVIHRRVHHAQWWYSRWSRM